MHANCRRDGDSVRQPFNEWAEAAFVPALICLLVTPLIVFIVDPPLLNATPKAPMEAAKKLQAMGLLTQIEKP